MDLRGWDYTGRNIGPELHNQFRIMAECLANPAFVNHSTWGNPIQDKLAEKMKVSSSGAVRTVKKLCDDFGFFVPNALTSRNEINPENFLSQRGKVVFQIATLEQGIETSTTLSDTQKKKAFSQVQNLYEEAYCDALMNYYFTNSEGKHFCPLRATLKALNKYGTMDKWEWYLLNTLVRKDDDEKQEAELDRYIKLYRRKEIEFSMQNVVEKPKGHQYIPQYFDFAGLVTVIQRPEWSISASTKHETLKNEILSDGFLEKLYGGR